LFFIYIFKLALRRKPARVRLGERCALNIHDLLGESDRLGDLAVGLVGNGKL
jgi:hypothetical protein